MRKFCMFAAIAMLACGPVAARDVDRGDLRQVVVPSAGLDLSSEAGVDILAARIDVAVKRICGWDRACQDEAWGSTEAQVADAIARARNWRRLAEERAAQLRTCRDRCAQPAGYYAPPPPPVRVIVIVG
ncbi:UrcA family protein [Sphingomonas sp.]|uniref:UrcA family protein n=1 Tax=Sphingomonas sp. TaxID=28214 RepID=UPI001EC9EF68|nr:UrcA family protein [Sphingomonas sp.]MBX3594265.1 UrcA family protein [Sphingomonas sp.]